MEGQLLSSALKYSKQGYRIFPVHTPNENGCSCSKPDCSSIGKHPRTPAGLKDGTQDVKKIRRWWQKWPDANIGLVTGGDFFVLDVDKGGGEELRKHPRLCKTLEAETGGGGRHLFFRKPAREQIRNRARFLPGLDIRGDGGYVVAPPSMHESGKQYTWKNECKKSVAPDWLIEAIRNNKKTDSKISALDRTADMIFKGQRNDTLLRKGCSILAKGLKRVDIPILIRGWNLERCMPPLNDAEVEKIIESVLSYDETGDLLSIIESSVTDSLEFMKKKIDQPECVIDPWLTDGSLSMIYAPRGVGKTWLCLIVAVAVTRKDYKKLNIGPWWVSAGAGTLYVDGEMSEFYLQKRLNKLTLPLGGRRNRGNDLKILSANRIAKDHRQQIKISDPRWRDALYEYLARHDEYQLLILDNIASLAPDIDENAKKDWDPINQWLLTLRHLGVAVVFVHHSGKGGQQRGTSGREDAVDNIIKLSKPENYMDGDGAFFKICFTKARNADPAGGSLSSFGLKVCPDETSGGLIWRTEEISGGVDKEVVMALLIDGKWKQREIAEQMSISQGRVAQIKKQAKDQGYLDGKGNVTGRGKKFVEGIDLSSYYGGG